MSELPLPIFLGVCYRAQPRALGWDLTALSTAVLFPFFPQSLSTCTLALAFPEPLLKQIQGFSIAMRYKARPEKWAEMTFTGTASNGGQSLSSQEQVINSAVTLRKYWGGGKEPLDNPTRLTPLPCPALSVSEPARVVVAYTVDGIMHDIGEIDCIFQQPPPLSDAERRAIMSRPSAMRFVYLSTQCKTCHERFCIYEKLDPSSTPERTEPEAVHVHDAPDRISCSCGQMDLDLTYAKLGMFDLFRRSRLLDNRRPLGSTPLYEAGAIDLVLQEYESLINAGPSEETVQLFLENNPIVWGFLSPLKILHKPCVLTGTRLTLAS